MANPKKPDDKKSEHDDKKDDDKGTQNKLLEYGKTFGAIIAVLFAVMDARVRPVIADAVEIAEQYGTRGSRLVRQLVDRHLVAFLRPFLIVSTFMVTTAYLLGWRWIYALGVDGFTAMGESGAWLGGIAIIATILPFILIGIVWKVRGLRDAGIRRLSDQVIAEWTPGWTEEQRDGLTDAQHTRINEEVQRRMNRDFGRPGYASRIAITLIAQWVIAAAWFFALAVVLKTWHQAEMIHAHVDPRWTSGLMVMSIVLTAGAVGWLTLAVSIAQASIKYALQPIVWALKLTVKSTVDWFDGASDTATAMARIVALPLEELFYSIGAVIGFPVGVTFGMLTLAVTFHTINQVAFIVMDACVWLGVYVFLVRTGKIMNEYLYRLILIVHSVWMVVGFILWAVQPTWMVVVDTAKKGDVVVSTGMAAYQYAHLVTPMFVFLFLVIAFGAAWLAKKTYGKSARVLYTVAVIFAVMGLGMVLVRSAMPAGSATSYGASGAVQQVQVASSGAGFFSQTVNAGSHSALQGHSCNLSDPNRPCR